MPGGGNTVRGKRPVLSQRALSRPGKPMRNGTEASPRLSSPSPAWTLFFPPAQPTPQLPGWVPGVQAAGNRYRPPDPAGARDQAQTPGDRSTRSAEPRAPPHTQSPQLSRRSRPSGYGHRPSELGRGSSPSLASVSLEKSFNFSAFIFLGDRSPDSLRIFAAKASPTGL